MKSTFILNIETEVREGGLAKFFKIFIHLNNAKVGIKRCELIFKVSSVERVSANGNKGRGDLSSIESLPVDWLKERMILHILSHQSFLRIFNKQTADVALNRIDQQLL